MDPDGESEHSSGEEGTGTGGVETVNTKVSGSNRACDFCHRMKMRCIGKENPPCNRCRASGHNCTFDGPRRSKSSKVEDRLRIVEAQMGAVQGSLQELLRLQRGSGSSGPGIMAETSFGQEVAIPPSNLARSYKTSPMESYTTPNTVNSLDSLFDGQMLSQPPMAMGRSHVDRGPLDPSPRSSQMGGSLASINAQRSPLQYMTMTPIPNIQSSSSNQAAAQVFPAHQNRQMSDWSRSQTGAQSVLSNAIVTQESSAQVSDDEEEGDPLETRAILAPWDSMLSLAEAARLQADGHVVRPGESGSASVTIPSDVEESSKKKKRGHRKRSVTFDYETPIISGRGNSGSEGGESKKRRKESMALMVKADALASGGIADLAGASEKERLEALPNPGLAHSFPDVVELGYCTEEEGREMFDLFFQGCSMYIPVYEPGVDTWESLRVRSPFSITTLIMIGTKVRDGGGPPSNLQILSKQHAERIGMGTLFTPISRIEALQAMTILAAFGDTSWRPGGHAMRMAMDMGLYRCLGYLAQRGMGAGKTKEEVKDERGLVVGARVWLGLYKLECEMAYNLGRPALCAGEVTIAHARQFLEHPLSIPTDSRLVASAELLTMRLPLHEPFSIWPKPNPPDLDEIIKKHNQAYDDWLLDWQAYYTRQGLPEGHFLRESLITQQCHAVLHTNSKVMLGVRSKKDVALLSPERRACLVKAIKAAEKLVRMALYSQQYSQNFRFANHYTHVGVAVTARFLIRLTSLLPEEVNLRQVGRDVEDIARALSKVPGFQFAQLLRDVVLKARRKRVLPPSSRAPSPPLGGHSIPRGNWDSSAGNIHEGNSTNVGPSITAPTNALPAHLNPFNFDASPPVVNPLGQGDGLVSHLDFLYAEQLFANTLPRGDIPNNDVIPQEMQDFQGNGVADQFYNLDTWFPFPPLDTDISMGLGGFSVEGDNLGVLQGNGGQGGQGTGGRDPLDPGRSGWW